MTAHADVKDMLARIEKDLADERELNDKARAEIKKHGEELPETKAALEKVGVDINGAKAAIDKLTKDLGRLTIGGGGGADSAASAKAAAKFFSMTTRKLVRPGDSACDMDVYSNYRAAFADLVRNQCLVDNLSPDVRAALSVGSDRDGGFFAPAEMSMELEQRIYETSPMRPISRVIQIGAGAWEAPAKSSQFTSGGWVAEKAARSSTATGTVQMQRIEAHEQYAYPEVTQTMLDDGIIDVESYLTTEAEDVMARTENTGFVSGTGVMQPRGFLDYKSAAVTTDDATRAWGVLQYVPSGAAGGFPKISGSVADDAAALITLMTKLNPVYRAGARWTMNRSTEATVRKLRDADGRYLVGFGDLGDGTFGFTLHGFPITNLEDMPDVASDSYSIAFGNFLRGYYIVDRTGFRVLRDPYSNKPYVGFYITKRTGGDVRNFDAIKLMKFATS